MHEKLVAQVEAGIDVPAGVGGCRKPYGKRPGIHARKPASAADELVERFVEDRRIGGPGEGLLSKDAKPDDRLGPRRRIVRIAAGIPAQDTARGAIRLLPPMPALNVPGSGQMHARVKQ